MERSISYPANLVHSVHVRLGWAQVELLRTDAQDVQTIVAGDEHSVKELHIRHEDGKLVIEQPQYGLSLNLNSKWMQVCVRVPAAWHGDIALTTVSGALSLKDVRGGEVSLDTVSGTVLADQLDCAALTLTAVSGAVQATRVTGNTLRVRNVSAAIGLHEVRFETGRVTTVTGHVALNFSAPFRTLDLQSVSADIDVQLPGGKAEASLRSVSGRLTLNGLSGGEHPPTVQAATVTGNVTIAGISDEADTASTQA